MATDPFVFERICSANLWRVWEARDGGLAMGDVFRPDGPGGKWFANVAPLRTFSADIKGEPIIGTRRGPFTSKRKAALYLMEHGGMDYRASRTRHLFEEVDRPRGRGKPSLMLVAGSSSTEDPVPPAVSGGSPPRSGSSCPGP